HTDARGLRLGTAAITTQGMGQEEMARIAVLFGKVLRGEVDVVRAREDVRELTGAYPPYPG
ncbi:serine hydroxymethyltransferase, partial [Streptomyces sp. SID5998]|nr:serine hydroxymethyltransferase [Streptomyces sp. SID5998]